MVGLGPATTPPQGKTFHLGLRHRWPTIVLVLGVIGAILAPFGELGYPINHSVPFNLSWAFQYQQEVMAGNPFPRWLDMSNFGFGNPTFSFYPPLWAIATLPFALWGWPVSWTLTGSMALALGVFGAGLYNYGQDFFPKGRLLWLTLLALVNPYLLINIYQRGAMAEVWAIAWIPWILWSTHRLFQNPHTWGPRLGLSLSYAALALSHLPTLLLFTLTWLGLPLWFTPAPLRPRQRLHWCQSFYGSWLLALGLSSLYLLPVLMDSQAVQLHQLHPDADYWPENRLLLTGLGRGTWQLTTHWFDKQLLPYGGLLVVVLGVGLGSWWASRSSQRMTSTEGRLRSSRTWLQAWMGYWLLLLLVPLGMVTDLAQGLYQGSPLAVIQFSWRWMTLTVVAVPLVLGMAQGVARRWWRSGCVPLRPFRIPLGLYGGRGCLGMLALALPGLVGLALALTSSNLMDQTEFIPETIVAFNQLATEKAQAFPQEPQAYPGEAFIHWHWRFADGLALQDVYEYRPKTANLTLPGDRPYPLIQAYNPAHPGPDPNPLTPSWGTLQVNAWHYGERQFRVENRSDRPQTVQIRTFAYPGWFFRWGQEPWQRVEASPQGILLMTIPPGIQEVTVRYRGTWAERVGVWITGITAGAIGLGGLKRI